MYKILLLTDFSVASRHAMAYTQALFNDTATDFCLVNAYQLQPELSYGGVVLMAEERELAEQALVDFKQKAEEQAPHHHRYRAVTILGGPEGAVDTLLKEEPFDLVVVGATGSGSSQLIGSVATGLIRSVRANILVVPTSAPIRPFRKVVLATDFRSVNDARCFALLNELVARKAALLTLLTIEIPKEATNQITALTREYVEQAFEGVQTDRYTIHDQSVVNGIDAYLDSHPVDMLVLLPHHKSVFDVVRNRSVSRSIAYHPRVPLLALYDPEAELPSHQKETPELMVTPYI